MLRKILFFSVCCLLSGVVGVAQAATWQVLGGTVFVPADPVASSPAFSAILTPGVPGTLVEGSYQGTDEILASLMVVSPDPNFSWNYRMDFYTSPFSYTGQPTPPPSVDLTAGTADLTSFNINWYEIGFESLGATHVPITANTDGSYHLTWQLTGGFSPTGTATMTMDIAPVPVPAAVWLLGSGLLGLIGMSRRPRRRA
jgi:hypothetical protein